MLVPFLCGGQCARGWRVNVFPCIRGVQCVRWIDVETRFPVSAEGNSLCGVSSKRVSLYPRRSGVDTCFLVPAEGNAFGGV